MFERAQFKSAETRNQNSMRGIKTYLRENETSWEEISDEMKLDSSCIKTKLIGFERAFDNIRL